MDRDKKYYLELNLKMEPEIEKPEPPKSLLIPEGSTHVVKYGLIDFTFDNNKNEFITYKVRIKEDYGDFFEVKYLRKLRYKNVSESLFDTDEAQEKHSLISKERVYGIIEKRYNPFQLFLLWLRFIE